MNRDHSAHSVKVLTRSHLHSEWRSEHKCLWESGIKKEGRKKKEDTSRAFTI